MNEALRERVLTLLRVPPQPQPPAGDPASLRVFHAGRNYLRLRLATWGTTQVFALAGIVFWTATLMQVERVARAELDARASAPAVVAPSSPPTDPAAPAGPTLDRNERFKQWFEGAVENIRAAATRPDPNAPAGRHDDAPNGWAGFQQALIEIGLVLPPQAYPFIWALKVLGFAIYLLQLPLTYAVRRLDYEMRWYMVTDRSLRLRHGVWKVSESTMSFANVQQVKVSQGPLQRVLGLADVQVQSAGGGGDAHAHAEKDLHLGAFHSVTNAVEIRDLILERLRQFREAGLGDPDDAQVPNPAAAAPLSPVAAAQQLVVEVRALRAKLS